MSRHVVEDARVALYEADVAALAESVGPRPLGVLDADRLGRQLDAGTLVILARDRRGRSSAAVWALSAEPALLPHDEAHPLWRAVAGVLTTLTDDPQAAPAQEPQS